MDIFPTQCPDTGCLWHIQARGASADSHGGACLMHLLDADARLVDAVLQDELLQEEERALVAGVLADLGAAPAPKRQRCPTALHGRCRCGYTDSLEQTDMPHHYRCRQFVNIHAL